MTKRAIDLQLIELHMILAEMRKHPLKHMKDIKHIKKQMAELEEFKSSLQTLN